MATSGANRPEQSATLIESQKGYDTRVIFFYFIFAAGIAVLVGGLVNQQIIRADEHTISGDRQSQRRLVMPGQRGEIYDRNGAVLATNQSRFSAVLYVDELRKELAKEMSDITRNYKQAGTDQPTYDQRARISRITVVQRYLDQLNALLSRPEPIRLDPKALAAHFGSDLLIPFTLVDELTLDEYARLIERLPVSAPLQVDATTRRYYPYGSSAAHAIGSIQIDPKVEIEDFHDDLKTFTFPGIVGRDGLEKQFNAALEGQAGGRIILVDPHGYTLKKDLPERKPVQGKSLTTSLDLDLQLSAEEVFRDELVEFKGAAVAMDVNTGEVLAMVSYPDYDLNDVSPRYSPAVFQKILEQQALVNRAVNGFYPPGSAFKLVVSIAGLRSGIITPSSTYTTDGTYRLGRAEFHDHHGCITGVIDFRTAIEASVNTFFINFGLQIGVDRIHDEAARLGLTATTGIELPEQKAMYVGNDAWKKNRMHEAWREGDTANLSFGQGFIQVTPLQMAAFMASLARGETITRPYLLHDPNRPTQHSEPIGLTSSQSSALIEGMERVITKGTASGIFGLPKYKMPGLTIAAKTGTAQKDATINGVSGKVELAWFVGYAPVQNPQIAIAVIVEGDTPDESFAGGRFAGPVAAAVLKKWWEKKNPPAGK